MAIVKPETVVAWHRAGFRLFWTCEVRRGQRGRPIISREVRDLIRKMCRENPLCGAPRIDGEYLPAVGGKKAQRFTAERRGESRREKELLDEKAQVNHKFDLVRRQELLVRVPSPAT